MPLNNEFVAYLYLDGFWGQNPLLRQGLPGFCVGSGGSKRKRRKDSLKGLRGSESAQAFKGVIEDLVLRGLPRPELIIIDGNGY